MANILDYLEWRGDLSFFDSPFNEVDNLIFAEASYVAFDDIVSSDLKDKKTVQQVSEELFSKYTTEELEASSQLVGKACLVVKKMAETDRFKDVYMSGYVNEIDIKTQIQFSAVTFTLPDGSFYVAYRGTDDTIVGWKEDFNMSFLDHTPGQQRAKEYLNQFKGHFKRLRVGGHSKGGNFAVYASAFCQPSIQKNIIEIYSNDGPGFKADGACCEEGYKNILDKINSIVPEGSFIGMIMKNDFEHHPVKSSNSGAMQHDALSWQVIGNHFEHVDSTNFVSRGLDATMTDWLSKIDDEERKVFVDAIFAPFDAGGVYTLTDLSNINALNLAYMLKSIKDFDSTQQDAIKDTVLKFLSSSKHVVKDKLKNKIL